MRSAGAEERQDAGFNAPSFNIPFQPNFQFNEFGSFLDGNQGFSRFISGLGGQGIRSPSSFVGQTEQRFTAPQFGNTRAQIGGSPFKRETGKTQTSFYTQPEPVHHQQHHEVHHQQEEPVYHRQPVEKKKQVARYDHEAVRAHQRQFTRHRQNHDSTDNIYNDNHRDFYQEDDFSNNFNEERMRGFSFDRNIDKRPAMRDMEDSSEMKVESREMFEDAPTLSQDDLKTIFDDSSARFNIDFGAEQFPEFLDIAKAEPETRFRAPERTESFNSPMVESEAFPFLDEDNKDDDQEEFKPFTDFGKNSGYQKKKEVMMKKMKVVKPQKYELPKMDVVKAEKYEMPKFSDFETVPRADIKDKFDYMTAPTAAPTKKPLFKNTKQSHSKLPTFSNFPQTKTVSTKKPTMLFKKKEKFMKDTKHKAYNYFKGTPKPFSNPKPSFSSISSKPNLSKPKPSFSSFPTKPLNLKPQFQAKPYEITKTEAKPSSPSKPSEKPSLPSFTNFKSESKSEPQPSFDSFPVQEKQSEPSKPFTTFKSPVPVDLPQTKPVPVIDISQIPEMIPTQPPTTTLKPYNYEKKNFREPVQQVNKRSGPHQIIRIKAPAKDMKPQPKQLFYNHKQQQKGFQPVSRDHQRPSPGQLLIKEVNRRQGQIYKPEEVTYDNNQPLLTLESLGGQFGGRRSRPDNFSVDVQASIQPNSEPKQRFLRRQIRLPAQRRSLQKTQESSDNTKESSHSIPVLYKHPPKFESARIVRQRRQY